MTTPQTQSLPSLSRRSVLLWVAVLQFALVATFAWDLWGLSIPGLRPALAILYLTLAPGMCLLLLLGYVANRPLRTLLYAAGMSFMLLMSVGVGLSWLHRQGLIGPPIEPGRLLASLSVIVGAIWVVLFTRYDLDKPVVTWESTSLGSLPLLGFCILLPLTLIGVTLQTSAGSSAGLLFVLVVISLIPLFVYVRPVPSQVLPFGVFFIAVSLLYHHSLWSKSYPIEMWMGPLVLERGYWGPTLSGVTFETPNQMGVGQETILTESLLYPLYATVSGLDLMTQLTVVNPLIVTIIPLAMFEFSRRYIGPDYAFLATCFFLFTFRLYSQHYPNAARDVMATVFLSLLGVLIVDENLSQSQKTALSIVFVCGIAVAHYGTAFLFILVLFIALCSILLFDLVDRYDGSRSELFRLAGYPSGHVVNPALVVIAITATFAWLLYAADGYKLNLLSIVLQNQIQGGFQLTGPAARVLSVPDSTVTYIVKWVYVVMGGIIGLGVVGAFYDRLTETDVAVSDSHLGLSAGLLSLLALSFLPISLGFNTGRVIMIVFPFTAIFIITGFQRGHWIATRILSRITGEQTDRNHWHIRPRKPVQLCIALSLVILLLLNTGVVSETVTHDYAPSDVLTEDDLQASNNLVYQWRAKSCVSCGASTATWLFNYGEPNAHRYSGGKHEHIYYWYGADVMEANNDIIEESLLTDSNLSEHRNVWQFRDTMSPGSYIVLYPENTNSGHVVDSEYGEFQSLESLGSRLTRANRVYSTGETTIYRTRSESEVNSSTNATR